MQKKIWRHRFDTVCVFSLSTESHAKPRRTFTLFHHFFVSGFRNLVILITSFAGCSKKGHWLHKKRLCLTKGWPVRQKQKPGARCGRGEGRAEMRRQIAHAASMAAVSVEGLPSDGHGQYMWGAWGEYLKIRDHFLDFEKCRSEKLTYKNIKCIEGKKKSLITLDPKSKKRGTR